MWRVGRVEFILLSCLNGVSFGTILFFVASGLSLILGLMGILNLAHGAIFMVGGYVGWTVAIEIGGGYWGGLLCGGIAAAVLGLILGEGALKKLHKKANEQALLTIGVIFILCNLCQWIWGPRDRPPYKPPLLAGSFCIGNNLEYPIYRISIIGMGVLLWLVLWWVEKKTRLGAVVRAGMDDSEMVEGLGINLGKINSIIFLIGCFLSGAGGVVAGMLLGVRIGMAWDIVLLALIVIIIGGMGSVSGAYAGAMLIGIVESFGRILFPKAAMFLIYFVAILVLMIRPTGLFGKKLA